MTFALSSKASLENSLELVTASEIDALLEASRTGESDIDHRVHETRKSIKRLRALLRLYRGALGHGLYEREDTALRELGHSLGQAREAVALGESLDRLVLAAPDPVRARLADHMNELRSALDDRQGAESIDVGAALARVQDGLTQVRARAARWTLDRHGWSAIAPGLRRTYAKGRRTLSTALHRPSEKRLHGLRIWVKRHQYQLTLLEPLWPGPVKAFRQEAQELGELLGQEHDLSLLERRLEAVTRRPELAPLERPLRTAAEGCHGELRREAFAVGSRVYAEAPGRFAARYREYFDAWP